MTILNESQDASKKSLWKSCHFWWARNLFSKHSKCSIVWTASLRVTFSIYWHRFDFQRCKTALILLYNLFSVVSWLIGRYKYKVYDPLSGAPHQREYNSQPQWTPAAMDDMYCHEDTHRDCFWELCIHVSTTPCTVVWYQKFSFVYKMLCWYMIRPSGNYCYLDL